jgi:tRNA(Ile)-lysidine synthase
MNYEEILQTVRGFCAREKLLDGKKHLALAVSGGADSMALLCLMRPLAEEKGIALTVCHVNHGLRGETADRDEAFVREVCARLGLPLRVFHAAELEAEAGKPRAGEDWARGLRYACFERVLADGIDAVATAHTGSDQAETLLFRLARGTGLHGAAGIRPSRPGYLRPLLCLTRTDTEAVCRACGERWVTDETNDADDYARNRLRHGALPALCGVNSAAERNLARFCEKAAKADEYFARQADALLASARAADAKGLPGGAGYALRSGQPVWMSAPLRQTDPLILDMALHSLVEPVRDAEEKYIRLLADLVEKGSGAVQLTDAVRFCARDGVLWREEADKNTRRQGEKADGPKFEVSLPEGGDYPLPGGRTLQIRVVSACFEEKTQGVHKKDLKNQADYAKINSICPVLRLRCRQPGDRFRPAGRGVDRELRKWMNEAGIPPRERDTLPLLAVLLRYVAPAARSFARYPRSMQLLFGVVPLAGYLFDYVTRIYTDLLAQGNQAAVEFMPFVCSVAYIVFVLRVSAEERTRSQLEQTRNNLKLQVGQAVREIEALRTSQQQTRAYRHDLRHHLQYISACIENGRGEQAQEYIQSICSEIEASKVTTYCENETANLIFSSFAGRAESCGVPLNIQAHIPQLISVAETDLCVLLSNALENALRACRRMKAENGPAYIEVTAREKNGHLFLQFVNPCPEGIQFENGLPVTHAEGHGIGVRSICAIVEKYKGLSDFSVQDGRFILRVSL